MPYFFPRERAPILWLLSLEKIILIIDIVQCVRTIDHKLVDIKNIIAVTNPVKKFVVEKISVSQIHGAKMCKIQG